MDSCSYKLSSSPGFCMYWSACLSPTPLHSPSSSISCSSLSRSSLYSFDPLWWPLAKHTRAPAIKELLSEFGLKVFISAVHRPQTKAFSLRARIHFMVLLKPVTHTQTASGCAQTVRLHSDILSGVGMTSTLSRQSFRVLLYKLNLTLFLLFPEDSCPVAVAAVSCSPGLAAWQSSLTTLTGMKPAHRPPTLITTSNTPEEGRGVGFSFHRADFYVSVC